MELSSLLDISTLVHVHRSVEAHACAMLSIATMGPVMISNNLIFLSKRPVQSLNQLKTG